MDASTSEENNYGRRDKIKELKSNFTVLFSDGSKIVVPKNIISLSDFFFELSGIEDGIEDEDENEIILPDFITQETFRKIIEFCEYHLNATGKNFLNKIDKPLRDDLQKLIPAWYYSFINVSNNMLFEIEKACDYLGLESLLYLACAKTASNLIGKTPDEIRKEFGITDDLTPEEKDAIKKNLFENSDNN